MMITRLPGCGRGSSPSVAVSTTACEMGGTDSGGGAPGSSDSVAAADTALFGFSDTTLPLVTALSGESTGDQPRRRLVLLREDLFTLAADSGQDGEDERACGQNQKHGRNGMGDKDRGIAARDDHRPSQVLLEQWTEHKAEQQGRRLGTELDQDVS